MWRGSPFYFVSPSLFFFFGENNGVQEKGGNTSGTKLLKGQNVPFTSHRPNSAVFNARRYGKNIRYNLDAPWDRQHELNWVQPQIPERFLNDSLDSKRVSFWNHKSFLNKRWGKKMKTHDFVLMKYATYWLR